MVKKRVFICSPFKANDYVSDTKKYVLDCCKAACKMGVAPFAPHAMYVNFLDDNDPEDREVGMECGMTYLAICSELWVCSRYISDGMMTEITYATENRITIKFFDLVDLSGTMSLQARA